MTDNYHPRDQEVALQLAVLAGRVDRIAEDLNRLMKRDERHEEDLKVIGDAIRAGLKEQSKEFRDAIDRQNSKFTEALNEISKVYMKKEEFGFWRKILEWGVMGALGFAVSMIKLGSGN